MATVGLNAIAETKRLNTMRAASYSVLSKISATADATPNVVRTLATSATVAAIDAASVRCSWDLPFSPTTTYSITLPSAVPAAALDAAREYLVTAELIPPQSPLSVVIATVRFFSTSASGVSPRMRSSGRARPRETSVAACATRIFDAATIFMADVIF